MQKLWWLSFSHINNPCQAPHAAVRQLSAPGIFNILHCACSLLFLFETVNVVTSRTKILMSEYMLLMAEMFIDGFATILIRITAPRFSACLMQIMTFSNFWGKGWKNNDGKMSYVVLAMLLVSVLRTISAYMTVMEQFQAMQSPWILGENPGLALFVIFFRPSLPTTLLYRLLCHMWLS